VPLACATAVDWSAASLISIAGARADTWWLAATHVPLLSGARLAFASTTLANVLAVVRLAPSAATTFYRQAGHGSPCRR